MRRGSAGPKRQSMPLGQISKHEFHIGISLQDIAAPGSGEPNRNPLHFIKHDIVARPVVQLRGPRRLVCRDAWAFSPQISQIYG